MKDKEILNLLKQYDNNFDFASWDFDNLMNVDISLMGLISDKTCDVTPLLDQIAFYALGYNVGEDSDYCSIAYAIEEEKRLNQKYEEDDEEIEIDEFDDEDDEDLEELDDEDVVHIDDLEELENGEAREEANEVMYLCNCYMNELIKAKCQHPTVLKYRDLNNGEELYNTFLILLGSCMSTINLSDHATKTFYNFISLVDEKINSYLDIRINQVYSSLEYLENPKDLIHNFATLAKEVATSHLLVSGNYTLSNIDSNWLRVLDAGDSNYTLLFTHVIKEINKIFNDVNTSDADRSLLSDINDVYDLYKNYQFDYIRNNYKEGKIFEKCKKK